MEANGFYFCDSHNSISRKLKETSDCGSNMKETTFAFIKRPICETSSGLRLIQRLHLLEFDVSNEKGKKKPLSSQTLICLHSQTEHSNQTT